MRPNWFIALPVEARPWFDARFEIPSQVFRRFHPDDLHMTVAFLGAVEETQARTAFRINTLWGGGPMDVTLGPVVPMGNPRRYSALSVLLADGKERVCELLDQVKAPMLEAVGAKPDSRPHKPHITVARPKRKASKQDRREGLDWAADFDLSDVRVRLNRIALYTWSEDRRERLFHIVDERGY